MSEHWSREIRIFDFCINHARQIIAELQTSYGDYDADVAELEGLIELWEHLRLIAEEVKLNEKQAKPAKAERP